MRAVTGKPIRFVGLGEKMDALETFEAERVAGRILGMGDIVALVERARETFEAEQAERMAKRFAKGLFNMNDMRSQLEQMMKMGGMQGLMGMLPGMGGMAKKAEAAGFNDKMLAHQVALINSMTKKERANPDLLAASRKKRIAKGAGMEVSDLNKLIKQHQQMADMIKKMGKGGMMKQAIKQMVGKGAGGGMPDISKMSPEEMAEMAKGMQQGMGAGGGFPGLPRGMGLPQGLSGMMKKK
jgi:signal recognition particle subunit SRP54